MKSKREVETVNDSVVAQLDEQQARRLVSVVLILYMCMFSLSANLTYIVYCLIS